MKMKIKLFFLLLNCSLVIIYQSAIKVAPPAPPKKNHFLQMRQVTPSTSPLKTIFWKIFRPLLNSSLKKAQPVFHDLEIGYDLEHDLAPFHISHKRVATCRINNFWKTVFWNMYFVWTQSDFKGMLISSTMSY